MGAGSFTRTRSWKVFLVLRHNCAAESISQADKSANISTACPWRINSMDVDKKSRLLAVAVGPETQISRPMGLQGMCKLPSAVLGLTGSI